MVELKHSKEEILDKYSEYCDTVWKEEDFKGDIPPWCAGCAFKDVCFEYPFMYNLPDEKFKWMEDVLTSLGMFKGDYEKVDKPTHYGGTDCIENMRKLYGDDAVKYFCICNAYKYRYRAGHKPGEECSADLQKAKWYEDYAVKMADDSKTYY